MRLLQNTPPKIQVNNGGATNVRALLGVGPTGPAGADGSNVLPTDTAIKNAIVNPTSETAIALSASYVREGGAFADLGKQAGVDNTGVTECASAIQAALDSFLSLGVRAYAKGTFKIASTVTIKSNADLSDATFNYTGTNSIAVRVGTATSGSYYTNLRVVLPKRIEATAKTTTGWSQVTGSIGVELANLIACHVWIGNVTSFETGVKCYARGVGANYNEVHVGHLENNKVNLILGADSSGAMNESNYFGGRFSHYSAEGTNVSGTRHIEMQVCASPTNNNVFYKPSIEGDVAERHLIVAGSYNRVVNGRYETTGGARVRWASDAAANLIDHGYQAGSILEDFVSGASRTNCLASSDKWLGSLTGGSGGSVVTEAGSNSSPVDVIMPAGSRVAGTASSAAYCVARGALYTDMKATGDSKPRIRLDHAVGRLFLGTGSNDATAGNAPYFQAWAADQIRLRGGSLSMDTDNTYDIGISGAKPRYIRAGTLVQTGSNTTGNRPSASTAGAGAMYHDITLGYPIWSDGTNWRKFTDNTTV